MFGCLCVCLYSTLYRTCPQATLAWLVLKPGVEHRQVGVGYTPQGERLLYPLRPNSLSSCICDRCNIVGLPCAQERG